ncbi:ATP-dependent zinc protease family protein [Pseudomonas matsuisoli]
MVLAASAFNAMAEVQVLGRYEQIHLSQLGKTLPAKMDTGAVTASLSAKDIERFRRKGETWVRFRLAIAKADNTLYEYPVARVSKIKNRADEQGEEDEAPGASERPVIELEMCLGNVRKTVEVNLTDRSHFSYPLLIGAKALRAFDVAVDPAKKNVAGRPEC